MPPNEVILGIGDALAVLVDPAPASAKGRLLAAEQALQAASGRNDISMGLRASGRPRLFPPLPELGVSTAHRGQLLLAGFSPTCRVGVDLDPEDPCLDPVTLARDHFTPAEAGAIAALHADAARDLFLRLWVAKEAALKIVGHGIAYGLLEPDLGAHVAALSADGTQLAIPPSHRLPALRLAVRRLERLPPAYCALAVEAA